LTGEVRSALNIGEQLNWEDDMSELVISADNHLIDPKDLYVERMPKEFRERAPRVMRGADGGDGWSFDGRPPARTFGLEAVAGQPDHQGNYRPTGMKWEDILPGNYDGAAHLADMDQDGIHGAVVYPLVAMNAYTQPDGAFRIAMIETYNDWLLDDFVSVDPSRLVGLCALPVDDGMETSVAEVHRCVAKGARGFFVPGSPATPYWDPSYDPLWRALSETQTAVSFHRNHGGRPRVDEAPALDVPGFNVGGIVVRFFSAITPLTYMIFTGVFQRFPELKVVVGEVNCGWMPFWLENMDQNWQQQKHWAELPFDRAPSSYAGENVFVTTLDDRYGFSAIAHDPSLASAVMYSIDYPHSVTLWPNSARLIPELTAGMDAESRHKVLAGNAERVFHFSAG
jgi:predicted TIM-barrel fold metal-dependent hydrolase